MPKKITLDLLRNSGLDGGNVIDDLLDKQIQQIENQYGQQYSGLGNKILSLFVQDGNRLQLSEDEIVIELQEKRKVDKETVYTILRQLEQKGIIRCTSGNRYELANNVLAQRANQKVEAENRVLRSMKATIRDRMSRNELLDEQYLSYIQPSLTLLELDQQETKFVEDSKAAIRRRKRLAQWFYAIALAVLVLLTSWALRKTVETRRINDELIATNVRLTDAQDQLRDALVEEEEARSLAQKEANKARDAEERALRNARQAALSADTARYYRRMAEIERDSAFSLRDQAEAARQRADRLAQKANDSAEDARIKREEAEDAQRAAQEASDFANALSEVVVALNAAAKSREVEDPELRAKVARQAYNINVEAAADIGQPNHPYIFNGLYYGLKELNPGLAFGVTTHSDNGTRGNGIQDILYDSDNEILYTAGSDGRVFAHQIKNWNRLGVPQMESRKLRTYTGGVHNALALSPDKKTLLIAGELEYIQQYDLENDEATRDFWHPEDILKDEIKQVAFLENGQYMCISPRHFYVYLPDRLDFLRTDKKEAIGNTIVEVNGQKMGLSCTGRYTGEFYQLYFQTFSSGRRYDQQEYSFRGPKTQFNYGKLTALQAFQAKKEGWIAMGFENGQLLLAYSDLKGGNLLDRKGRPYELFKQHQAPISKIIFSESGRYMAAASLDGTATAWDLEQINDPTYQPIILDDHDGRVLSLSFVNGDRTLVTGTQGGGLYFWSLDPDDYADRICRELLEQFPGPRYDLLDEEDMNRFFGENQKERVCH